MCLKLRLLLQGVPDLSIFIDDHPNLFIIISEVTNIAVVSPGYHIILLVFLAQEGKMEEGRNS